MRLAAVIPTWNEESRIGPLLHELSSTEGLAEIVVADGGSTDRTAHVAAGFPRVRCVQAARGRASQMNAGARAVTSDVVWFVHADARVPRDGAAMIRRALADHKTVGGAFRIRTINDLGAASWASSLLWLADIRSAYSRVPYGDQAIFVRREVFERLGGFPEQPLMEDLAFSLRLRRAGRVRVLPARVRVSGRRFLQRPIYYTAAVNLFPLLYHVGVAPETLKRWYGDPR